MRPVSSENQKIIESSKILLEYSASGQTVVFGIFGVGVLRRALHFLPEVHEQYCCRTNLFRVRRKCGKTVFCSVLIPHDYTRLLCTAAPTPLPRQRLCPGEGLDCMSDVWQVVDSFRQSATLGLV